MLLSAIRTAAIQRANMENSSFLTTAEWNANINASYLECYDLIVSRFEDQFMKLDDTTGQPPTFTLTSSNNTYAVPSDMYKLRGLDYQYGSNDWGTVDRFNFAERNSRSRAFSRLSYGLKGLSYRVIGSKLTVLPPDQAAGTYRIWYVPRLTQLVADTDDTAGTILDFEEYLVVDAAIKALVKEESDPSALMAAKEGLKQRILTMSSNRDAGRNERVGDVRGVTGIGRRDSYLLW